MKKATPVKKETKSEIVNLGFTSHEKPSFPIIIRENKAEFEKASTEFIRLANNSFNRFKEICAEVSINPTFDLFVACKKSIKPFQVEVDLKIDDLAKSFGGFKNAVPKEVKSKFDDAIYEMGMLRENLNRNIAENYSYQPDTQHFRLEYLELKDGKIILNNELAEDVYEHHFVVKIDSEAEFQIQKELRNFENAYNSLVGTLINNRYPLHVISITGDYLINFFNEDQNGKISVNDTAVKFLRGLKLLSTTPL